MRLSRFTDTREHGGWGVWAIRRAAQRLSRVSGYAVRAEAGLQADYASRRDNVNRFVGTLVLSVNPASAITVIPLAPSMRLLRRAA